MAKSSILNVLCTELGIKISALERKIGVANGTIVKSIQRDSDMSNIVREAISKTYPNVRMDWLLTGRGPIFMDNKTNNSEKPNLLGRENYPQRKDENSEDDNDISSSLNDQAMRDSEFIKVMFRELMDTHKDLVSKIETVKLKEGVIPEGKASASR